MPDSVPIAAAASPNGGAPEAASLPRNASARLRRATRFVWIATVVVTALLVVAGSLLRWTVRDRWPIAAPLFYGLPRPVLACLALGVALDAWRTKRRRAACMALAFGVGWGVAVARHDFGWHPPVASDRPPVKLLFWNCGHGTLGWGEIVRTLRASDADLIVLTESGNNTELDRVRWADRMPGWVARPLVGEMLLLVRREVETPVFGALSHAGEYAVVEVRLRDDVPPLTLLAADLESHLVTNRRWPLEALVRRAAAIGEKPILIVGDFNTPPDSVHLDPLRTEFVEAFEAAGYGYGPTWTIPLPTLTLDQVWGNARLRFRRCERDWTLRSDHRPVRVEFDVLPP